MIGPVQVLVVGFTGSAFSGAVLAEFARLKEAGIVRLIDLLLVTRAEDGTIETLGPPTGAGTGLGSLAAALLGQPAGEADDEPAGTRDGDGAGGAVAGDAGHPGGSTWSLADAVPAGSAAAIALIEHTWAAPLTAAIREAGGTPLEETWLAPADIEVLEALIARRAR